MLCAIQWSMPMDSSPLLVAHDHEPNSKSGPTDIRLLREVFARYKAIQVDPAEFACMKAVALFKPGNVLFRRMKKTRKKNCEHC